MASGPPGWRQHCLPLVEIAWPLRLTQPLRPRHTLWRRCQCCFKGGQRSWPAEAVAAVPSVEVAVTAQAEAPECLITVADSTSPVAIGLAGFALIGILAKLIRNKSKKKA